MDLQLYRVDDQHYLVDFRNLGYYMVSEKDMSLPGVSRQGHSHEEGASNAVGSVPSATSATAAGAKEAGIGGVSGPFHFLEMACQLIAELASG